MSEAEKTVDSSQPVVHAGVSTDLNEQAREEVADLSTSSSDP